MKEKVLEGTFQLKLKNLARLSFIEADSDERLKRAIKSKINSHDDEFYKIGDYGAIFINRGKIW